MPQCEQLHRDLQISWDMFGDQITVEVAVRMGMNEYVAFGMSGSPDRPEMVGGDAVVLHRDEFLGYAIDVNMTSKFPCTKLLNQKKGVCPDEQVGGIQDYQLMSSIRNDGITVFTYRRRLITADTGDIPYVPKGAAMIIWAIGGLDDNRQATMHRAWSKVAQLLDLGRVPSKNCYSFTHDNNNDGASWKGIKLTDPNTVEFTARLGPDGGPKGYSAMTGNPSVTGKSWYINGYLSPELYLRRNRAYKFLVEGGASPHDPANYHPLIITDEPHGGFSQMSAAQKAKVRILAGVDYTQRGEVRPMSLRGGRLCEWKHPDNMDRRRDADIPTFPEYRNALTLDCGKDGGPVSLNVFPNKSWPATVYYNSWTGFNMGWKIHILDEEEKVTAARLTSESGAPSAAIIPSVFSLWSTILALTFLSLL
uniref:Protein Skeletor, isoforms B/C-like n=2 Tax=Hirondellea gigas TaxID=1518452 RepID=A0A6A7FRZ4_9CRUS